jgi:peptide/nickel transport system permease protein
MYIIPGDPLVSIIGPTASPESRARMKESMGLNDPFWLRYWNWLKGVFRGDFGDSIFLGRPVYKAIMERLPVTFSLGVGALFVALLIGLPAGILSAIRENGFFDSLVMLFSLAGLSTAEFVLGLVLIYIFAVGLGWFPVGGYIPLTKNLIEGIRSLTLPCFTLGFIWSALVARMTRATMIDILGHDYIRTARAKGLTEKVVLWKHALRVAAIPIVTVLGYVIVLIVSGAFITEIVFSLPGMGNLMVNSVLKRDYPVVQGGMLFIASGILFINLFIDVIYVYLDPRIKYHN